MGMMGQGQNLASSLTAALAPTLLQSSSATTTGTTSTTTGTSKDTPKIRVTDEHDRPISFQSDSSRLNDIRMQYFCFIIRKAILYIFSIKFIYNFPQPKFQRVFQQVQ
jgi:hypothetical protein